MGLSNNPICRKCDTEEETSVHVCVHVRPWLHSRHLYLGSFFFDPEDIRKLNIGTIWKCAKGTGLL